MSICSRTRLMILLALPVVAQPPSAGTAKQNARKDTSDLGSKPQNVTADGVIAMVAAGLSDEVIIARLRKEDKPFDLSSDDMIRLRRAKVSDTVLRVMLDPKSEIKPESGAVVRPESVVIRSPVIPGIASVDRSGATPGPGTAAADELNNPLAPHDSGIYVYTKDREGKPTMILLERAAYQGSKTGGILPSAITYGIVKARTKAVIPGPRASIRISDSSPVFYFYFEEKQASLGKTYFGIGSLSSPNQFALLRLSVSKSNRETLIGQFSALGTSSGTDVKAMVPFKSERIRAGLYKVVVDRLKSGEYCFLASSGNMVASAYGAGAAGATDIFDFGVAIE